MQHWSDLEEYSMSKDKGEVQKDSRRGKSHEIKPRTTRDAQGSNKSYAH